MIIRRSAKLLFTEPLFLFLFLPLLLPLNLLAGRRFGNPLLIASGLIFYASGENGYVFLLIYCIVLNWLIGLLMGRTAAARSRRALLFFGIAGNLAPLLAFRYAGFAADNLNVVLKVLGAQAMQRPEMHIPLGLSFFTFQSMAYLIDIYRRDIEPAKNPSKYALYLALFPHLIAGPIVRYKDLSAQLERRAVTRADFAEGARRFIVGLGKKRLIADTLAMRSDRIFDLPVDQLTTPLAWLGAVCYMLQIYFDFSGYSDMAIGLARMLGFTFLENFNYPYISRSITEFWRRWHISLSTWFRDYLYIPLGGNRRGIPIMYRNLLITMSGI